MGRHRTRRAAGEPGGRLVALGGVLFLAGVVVIAVVFGLFADGSHNLPTALDALAGGLAPVGFGLALVGLWRRARAGQQGVVAVFVPPEPRR